MSDLERVKLKKSKLPVAFHLADLAGLGQIKVRCRVSGVRRRHGARGVALRSVLVPAALRSFFPFTLVLFLPQMIETSSGRLFRLEKGA